MSNRPRPAYNLPTNSNPVTSITSSVSSSQNLDELRPPPLMRPLLPPVPRGERPVGRLQPPPNPYLHHRSTQLHLHNPLYNSIRSTPVSRPRSNANSRPGSRPTSRPGSRPGSRPSSKPSSRSNSPPPPSSVKQRLHERIRERERERERGQDREKGNFNVGDTQHSAEIDEEIAVGRDEVETQRQTIVNEDDISFGSDSTLKLASQRDGNWTDSRPPPLFPKLSSGNPESLLARRRQALTQKIAPQQGYAPNLRKTSPGPSMWSRTSSMPVSPPNERTENSSDLPTSSELSSPIKIEENEQHDEEEEANMNDSTSITSSSSRKEHNQAPTEQPQQQHEQQYQVPPKSRLSSLYQQRQQHQSRLSSTDGRRVGYRSSISSLRQSRAMLLDAARRTVDQEPREAHFPTQTASARNALEASVKNLERTLHESSSTTGVGGFRRVTYGTGGNSRAGMSSSVLQSRRQQQQQREEDMQRSESARWNSRSTPSRYGTRTERVTDDRERDNLKMERKSSLYSNFGDSKLPSGTSSPTTTATTANTEPTAAELWARRKAELSRRIG